MHIHKFGRTNLSGRTQDAAEVLAAGFLRGRRREINYPGNTAGFSQEGLDVFGNVSVHSNEPGTKGEGR